MSEGTLAARIDAFAEALKDPADTWFMHDGLMHWTVTARVVHAYSEGRLKRLPSEAILRLMMTAYVGDDIYRACHGDPNWVLWRCARAWAWRLARLEETVRGAGRAAA